MGADKKQDSSRAEISKVVVALIVIILVVVVSDSVLNPPSETTAIRLQQEADSIRQMVAGGEAAVLQVSSDYQHKLNILFKKGLLTEEERDIASRAEVVIQLSP